jgi:hypothetical protein
MPGDAISDLARQSQLLLASEVWWKGQIGFILELIKE